jgi:4-hydroxythreonine-4-phosphate dehydrogenase
MSGWIGISLGDITGIGPEVTLKAVAAELAADDTRYLLIGDPAHIRALNERLGQNLDLREHGEKSGNGRVFLSDTAARPLPPNPRPGAPEVARAAVDWVREAAERCLRGEIDAMITAPVNKEAIVNAGVPFVGQTEFLSELAKTDRTAMMLLGCDDRGRWLRVALATTHVAIKDVSRNLTAAKVSRAIELAAQSCSDLGLPRARVAVCGLNPHAGEGGKMGDEEITTIGPTVQSARKRGIDAVGPLSADALFFYAYRGDYDAVVAMYHDQGLVPLKMIGFETGVNWTLGLPFIRTSPDHGTAYDIAGKNQGNPSSMIAAIRLAKQLARKKRGQRG